jgi:undecaprenyl-diphosphatase
MRSVTVIGWTMLIFGIVLYWADQKGPQTKRDGDWTLRDAIVMGLWQAVALIPGTSRSGITITAGRMLGYDRESAARLAMLMSIPTILASGAVLGWRSSPTPMRRPPATAPSPRPWPSSRRCSR